MSKASLSGEEEPTEAVLRQGRGWVFSESVNAVHEGGMECEILSLTSLDEPDQ